MSHAGQVFVSGLLGMAAGAAKGFMDWSLEDQKAKIQAQRDDQLSKLRAQEHATERQSDLDFAEHARQRTQQRVSDFFANNGPTTTGEVLPGQAGDESGMLGTAGAPQFAQETPRQTAERQHAAALKTGDMDIIARAEKNLETARADEKGQRDERRLDQMQTFQEKQAERQNMLAEATLAHQRKMQEFAATQAGTADKRAEAATVAAQRQATATALKGVSDDIKALEKEGADPMLDPAKKKVIDRQLASLRDESAGYRKALAGAGLLGSVVPEAPVATAGGNDPLGLRKPTTPEAKPSAPVATPQKSAPAEGDLTKATIAQLYQAVGSGDEAQKRVATEELRRRGLLKDEEPVGGGGGMLSFDRGY